MKVNFKLVSIDALNRAEQSVRHFEKQKNKYQKACDYELTQAKRHLALVKENIGYFISLIQRSQKFAMCAHYTLNELESESTVHEAGWYLLDISNSRYGGHLKYGYCFIQEGTKIDIDNSLIGKINIESITANVDEHNECYLDGEIYQLDHESEVARYAAVVQYNISPTNLIQIT